MKTKIIYISGNEVFEMAEIRAAFDQVRAALGLDNDTILFGVPVDSDSAISDSVDTNPIESDVSVVSAVNDVVCDDAVAPMTASVITPTTAETIIKPENDIVAEPAAETMFEPVVENIIEPVYEPVAENDPVIPILSVLSVSEAVNDVVPETEPVAEPEPEIITEPVIVDGVEPEIDIINPEPVFVPDSESVAQTDTGIISDISLDTKLVSPIGDTDTANPDVVSIGDMIGEAVPQAPKKQTLEDLLESMKPLREDVEQPSISDDGIDILPEFTGDDATLAQLASEFVDSADTITSSSKAENHGAIGKLKNIIPFKKRNRNEDVSLMGDLLSWAGVAANDDEISIPGFFTNAVGKK